MKKSRRKMLKENDYQEAFIKKNHDNYGFYLKYMV